MMIMFNLHAMFYIELTLLCVWFIMFKFFSNPTLLKEQYLLVVSLTLIILLLAFILNTFNYNILSIIVAFFALIILIQSMHQTTTYNTLDKTTRDTKYHLCFLSTLTFIKTKKKYD